jgi:hypothetical protein
MASAARLIRADFKDKGRTRDFGLSEENSDHARSANSRSIPCTLKEF